MAHSHGLVIYNGDSPLGLGISLASGATKNLAQIICQSLVIAKGTLLKHYALLETFEESASFMVVIRQRHTIAALHIDGCIATVSLKDLDIADGVALAMDGEAKT